ncbi:MAG: hypothetical protein MUC49_13375 [Raineya sp.]|jgi:hypothetical protein|nr:hypothetical protein [Raineya sp.]
MKRKHIQIIVVITTFIIFVCWRYYEMEMGSKLIKCPTENVKKEIMPFAYRALVVDKYIDTNDHYTPYITINNFGFKYNMSLSLVGGYGGQWNNIDIGDSIYKKKGTLNFLLKKRYGRELFIEYKCDPDNIPNWE